MLLAFVLALALAFIIIIVIIIMYILVLLLCIIMIILWLLLYIHFISVLSLSSSTPGSFFELVRRTGGLQRSLGGHQHCASKCSNLAPKIKNTQPRKLTLDMENAWKNDEKCAKSVDQGKAHGISVFSLQVEPRWPVIWLHRAHAKMEHGDFQVWATSHPPFSPEKTQNETMV